jgi:hypothetical protein
MLSRETIGKQEHGWPSGEMRFTTNPFWLIFPQANPGFNDKNQRVVFAFGDST